MFPTRRQFDLFCSVMKIDSPAKLRAIETAYRTAFWYLGPFITKIAADMLSEMATIVTSTQRRPHVLFIGRDAAAIGYAIEELTPGFHNQFCSAVAPLSRALADTVAEEAAFWFPDSVAAIEQYRKPGPHRELDVDVGAWQGLVDFLEVCNAYLDNSDALFILVDTGYKGSIQEMLTVAYPNAVFYGLYAFYAAATRSSVRKKGMILNLDYEQGWGGQAIRDRIIDDPALLFAHHDAVVAVEELLRGESETNMMKDPLDGLNPTKISAYYTERDVRRATLALHQIAITAYAAHDIDARDNSPETWYSNLGVAAERFPRELYAWLTRRPCDAALRTLLDSFVRRADKHFVKALAEVLEAAGVPKRMKRRIWRSFDQQNTLSTKGAFVESLRIASQGRT